MKISPQFWRKLKAIVIALGMTLLLTGCDELPEDLQLKIANAFRERATMNLEAAKDLHDAGILSDTVFNNLNKSIEQNLTQFGASIEKADSKAGKNMLKAITAWRVVPQKTYDINGVHTGWKSPGDSGTSESDFAYGFITNAIIASDASLAKGNVPILGGNNKIIQPIEVISESLIDQMNADLSVPVYVLKTDIAEGVGIDGLMEAVRQAADQKSAVPLTQYFEPGYYMNGNTKTELTLLDPTNEDEQLVRLTTGYKPLNDGLTINQTYQDMDGDNTWTTSAAKDTTSYPRWDDGFINGVSPCYGSHFYGFPNNIDPSTNRLGKDMCMVMNNEPILTVRLIEFNQDAIDTLKSKIGVGIQRYLVIDNKAYLMEYPVGYVAGFKETEDRTGYNAMIEKSQIGFNLLTGNWSKFSTDDDGNITNESSDFDTNDPYLTFDGALSATDKTKASLVISGSTGVSKSGVEEDECNPCWNLVFGEYTDDSGNKHDRIYNTGRLVLRDYLEATYAPGVVGTDSLVVLGRKMRIELSGNKKDPVATFYDKSGDELAGSPKLYIQDFADIDAIFDATQKVKYISGYQEDLGDSSGGTTSDTGGTGIDPSGTSGTETAPPSTTEPEEDEGEAALRDSLSKVDSIPTEIVSKIRVSTKFPGKLIGYTDYDESDKKPMFYAMFVRANMFQTALFSGWVQNTDQTANSTVWWNGWLTEHGYTYRINTDNLVNYLKGNYAYDLAQEGVIILDLETIAKIQQDFNKDEQLETAHWMRTVFMVFGYILIGYAVIMLIAWNVDVNVDLGFNILEKLSFGKWVAIKDYDEMPYMNTTETNFVKFSELLISCIIIISIGLVLILVNVVDLILMIIQLFGGLASYISKMITGV